MEFLPLVLLAVLFWLLIIRPQRNRAAAQGRLMASLEPGQQVVTAGGLHGRIEQVDGEAVRLEIAPGTVVSVDKRAIAQLLEDPGDPGTLGAL